MSSFTEPLVLQFNAADNWTVYRSFIYFVGHEGSAERITVHVGFRTDGATIPRPFRWLYSPWGTWAKAAVVHDYLYRNRRIEIGEGAATTSCTRAEADAIFDEAMEVCGVSAFTRFLFYWSVRAFGWIAWNRATRHLSIDRR